MILFYLITEIEKSFSKFCDYSDAFNLTVDDFFSGTLNSIKWPCSTNVPLAIFDEDLQDSQTR